MNFKDPYTSYIKLENTEGSNRASSYIRAIDLLDSILRRKAPRKLNSGSIWETSSPQKIQGLYQYVLQQQRVGENGIFGGEKPISYWRDRFCSAALKSYGQFLVVQRYENELWDIYHDLKIQASELSKQLATKEIGSIDLLISDQEVNFSTKEGKDVLRETKARVNQNFFRKMLLRTYETRCCVSGLNIPAVLRASHIVAWKDDKENRLNPANGLCLSATYDAAFDRYLISFDEDYRMILSPILNEYYCNDAFKTQFKRYEGQRILLPKRFAPDQTFLEKHRAKTFNSHN